MSLADTLRAKFPGKTIEEIVFIKIGDNLYVDNVALAQIFDIDKRTIPNWKKMGLSPSDLSPPKAQIYQFFDLLNWHRENVKTANASIGKGSKPIRYQIINADSAKEDIGELDEAGLRQLKMKVDIEIKQLDLAKAKGQLIPIEEFGRGQAEIAMMFLGNLRTFLGQWAFQFADKKPEEIKKIMDEAVYKMVSSMQADIQKNIGQEIDISYYDVLHTIIESGKTPEEVINLVSKA